MISHPCPVFHAIPIFPFHRDPQALPVQNARKVTTFAVREKHGPPGLRRYPRSPHRQVPHRAAHNLSSNPNFILSYNLNSSRDRRKPLLFHQSIFHRLRKTPNERRQRSTRNSGITLSTVSIQVARARSNFQMYQRNVCTALNAEGGTKFHPWRDNTVYR